jgi:hypothetical protein
LARPLLGKREEISRAKAGLFYLSHRLVLEIRVQVFILNTLRTFYRERDATMQTTIIDTKKRYNREG